MAEVGNITIPQFKDKTIYWTSGNQQVSYPVSRSFRGILRLSPNDDGTLKEDNSNSLFGEDATLDIYYKDSVEDELQSQFVRTSTSDGYFIDWRLTQYQTEFNNLYIIGPSYQDQLRVYTKTQQGIVLDGYNYLPVKVNPYVTAQAEGSLANLSKDVVSTDITARGDLTYLLVNEQIKEKRIFEYRQIRSIIQELVLESMLDLCTTPTGAIHYVPIKLSEYNKLMAQGRPNNFKNATGNGSNDPIIRDYLVCDGSLYRNIDFPELAKVLRDEVITYWEPVNGVMVKKTHQNDYSKSKYFRVPDLRRTFIKSVYLTNNGTELDNPWCETGHWMNDTRPEYAEGKTADNHRHFIASAHYQSAPNMSQFPQVAYKDKTTGEWAIGTGAGDINPQPGVLSPANKANTMWKLAGFGSWYNVGRFGEGCRDGYVVPANNCNYFLSTPKEFDFQDPKISANYVLSSEDFSSCLQNPTKDTQISYNDLEYADFATTPAVDSYGMENTPEYYAMLPLIKI